jgi:hypothetical protein
MDPFVFEQANKFLEKLAERPICRFLTSDWADLSGVLTLDRLAEKLQSRCYASLFDFYLDVRLFLEPRDPQDPAAPTINVLLEDITQWVTQKIPNLPRSQAEADYFRVRKLIRKLNLIFSAMLLRHDSGFPDGNPDPIAPAAQPLVSPKMPPQAGQKRIEVLQQRIEHLRTPEELQVVLRILQKHIPQFTLSPEVVIEGRFITKACANELRDYLNSVNA